MCSIFAIVLFCLFFMKNEKENNFKKRGVKTETLQIIDLKRAVILWKLPQQK